MNVILLVKELTPEATKLLIAAGADVNYKDKDGNTPLIKACWNNNSEVAKILIAAGADVNYEIDYGNTPLYYACYNDNYELVKFLIENGADKSKICWNTTDEIQKYLVHAGCNVPNDLIIKYGTEEQKSKIVITFEEACKGFEFTKLYINQGGDINKQHITEWTLLHYAVIKKDLEWVKFLVDKGADQKIKDINGMIPARISNINEIHFILKENINEPDNDGDTILHNYATFNDTEKIIYLISIGARFDIKNNKGKTAYDLVKDKNIFKTKEEQIDEVVGEDIKSAIEYLITKFKTKEELLITLFGKDIEWAIKTLLTNI